MASARKRMKEERPAFILKPYTDHELQRWRRVVKWWMTPVVIGFCLFYGFAYALYTPYLILMFSIPIAIPAVLVIWALPDTERAPTRLLEAMFWGFLISMIVWPNYLAVALPGLPWITVARLFGWPLDFALLISLSVSKTFRTELNQTIHSVPWLWRILAAFLVLQFFSIALSSRVGEGINQFLVALSTWTAMFLTTSYVFRKPMQGERFAAVLWGAALVVCAIGIVEVRHEQVPWAGHIPKFLKVEDELVSQILQGGRRAATGIYRAQSTFSTSLGFAEYIALALPFVLHFIIGAYRWQIKFAAILTVPFLIYTVLLTDSRLGVVGCVLALLIYPLFIGASRWIRDRHSLIGPAITLAYPAFFCAGIASTFFVGRLRAKVWGNGPQTASNQGRIEQWQMGIPKILSHPWGHGIGTGGIALGFVTQQGEATIDSYYLLILMEYGILGFILYFGAMLLVIVYAVKYAYIAKSGDRDYQFLVPIAIALVNFFIIKSVFSNVGNHPLIFMMYGIVAAFVYRIQQENAAHSAPVVALTPAAPPPQAA